MTEGEAPGPERLPRLPLCDPLNSEEGNAAGAVRRAPAFRELFRRRATLR